MNGIFVLIPIMVLGIAITGIIASSVLKLQRMRLEEATLHAGESGDMSDLLRQVSELQHDVLEMQERLDFAERILAQVRETPGLPAPPPHQLP